MTEYFCYYFKFYLIVQVSFILKLQYKCTWMVHEFIFPLFFILTIARLYFMGQFYLLMFNKWSLTPEKRCSFIDTVSICEQIFTQIFHCWVSNLWSFAIIRTRDLWFKGQIANNVRERLGIWYDKCEGTEGKILELTLPILSPLQPLFKWIPTSPWIPNTRLAICMFQ